MKENDGGPAFPGAAETLEGHQLREYGMSLRDWFAGQALAGQIASPNWPPCPLPAGEEESAAHWAYSFADAMLAARETTND